MMPGTNPYTKIHFEQRILLELSNVAKIGFQSYQVLPNNHQAQGIIPALIPGSTGALFLLHLALHRLEPNSLLSNIK